MTSLRIIALALATAAMIATPALAQRAAPPPVKLDPQIAKLRDAALQDDVAYDIVEGLTTEIGPRPEGSPQLERARQWAVVKLKALGFSNVRIEPYELKDVWVRGMETAEVVAPFPQQLRLTALGNSGTTPPEGITAPIVFFPSLDDLVQVPDGSLKGKIAFVSNAMRANQDGSSYGPEGQARRAGPAIAIAKGASAIVIRSIGSDHGRWPHTGVANLTPAATLPAAALSVSDAENLERMVKRGKPVTLHLTLTPHFVPTRMSGNVVAEVPGTDPAAGIVLIGGHLDSWDLGTGAIDDGAGVAITTAAARNLMKSGRHRRTIRVVWFGDEETGGFGGIEYARAHGREKHVLAAESDSGADRVWRVRFNLPEDAKAVADRVASALLPLGVVRASGVARGGTDVEPTLANGVATIGLDQDATRYFDYHHTPEDTLDRIDPEQLRQNVAAWTAMLAVVADAPEPWGPVSAK